MRTSYVLAAIAWAAVACAPPQADDAPDTRPTSVRAAGFDVGPVRTAAEYRADAAYAAADEARGETLALACIACHTLRPGEAHMLGPNLGHIVGAAAASKPDFAYSPALAESGLTWTPAALDAWLAAPATFVPGTSMVFAGFASADERRDLIAYLLRATEDGVDE